MKVLEIYNILDSISPFIMQAEWDNSGLNVGNMQADCKHVYIALELDMQVVNAIENESLLIVHHPLIFKALKTIQTDTYPANLIELCLQKRISVIAMHTNFDKTHLNKAFATKLCLESLNFTPNGEKDFSLIYSTSTPLSTYSLATHIKDILGLDTLRYTQKDNMIHNLYITCGSNATAYKIANKGDCIITGDIKYHDAMIAASEGISFIDVPHFESECIFSDLLAKALQKHHIQAIITNSHNPFCYI